MGNRRNLRTSKALRYFSTHCWQWEQIESDSVSGFSLRATRQSSSAFFIQGAASSGFVQHTPLLQDVLQERVEPPKLLTNLARREYQHIEREPAIFQ